MEFPHLFSPINVNGMELKNRIVMTAMHLGYTPEGEVTDQLVDFYGARAKGGVGLIIVGGCYVDVYAKGLPSMISIEDDSFLPKLTEFTEAVHKARDDVKICCQLYHGGAF